MAAILDDRDPQRTARLEQRALEKMLNALCKHTVQLILEARSRGSDLESREADFQLQAFAERRAQAMELLKDGSREPPEIRIARLERLIDAVDRSRAYFRDR